MAYEYPYIIYISTDKGNCVGLLYECKTREQACAFCSRKDTKGNIQGTNYSYFWTAKSNIDDIDELIKRNSLYIIKHKKIKDDGRFDDIMDEYGLRKLV